MIGSFIMRIRLLIHHISYRGFLVKHQITQVTQAYALWLLAFPKTKITLGREEISDINDIRENMTGQLVVIGRTVWGPKVPILKGTEESLSCVQHFLYLVSSSINVSIFHITWLGTFWTDLINLNKSFNGPALLVFSGNVDRKGTIKNCMESDVTTLGSPFVQSQRNCFWFSQHFC